MVLDHKVIMTDPASKWDGKMGHVVDIADGSRVVLFQWFGKGMEGPNVETLVVPTENLKDFETRAQANRSMHESFARYGCD